MATIATTEIRASGQRCKNANEEKNSPHNGRKKEQSVKEKKKRKSLVADNIARRISFMEKTAKAAKTPKQLGMRISFQENNTQQDVHAK